ncbi:amino acid permease [Rothia aerolata]|uniref:Gamma-aminobutyrate permease n=1 Tax=Rothia aerolata TaxID=1812262 RepID=A0A917IVW3_9MICC|nr:amino acid permease [Rothia aerolata]GGH65220.1 gamma-aminobutyrate permease [Rothia aerolata]
MTSQTLQKNSGELDRSLGHGQMTMIALGLAVGTGLFLGSGGAIAIAGPAVIVSYAIGSLIAAIIGACAGEMAVRYPVRGGFGTIAAKFLGPYAGYLTRWAYVATMVPLAGAELVAVGQYMMYWYSEIPLWAWVAVFALVIVGLNATTVKNFGTLEFFLSSIKVIAVIVFILFGLVLVFFGLPDAPASGLGNLTNDGGFMPNGLGSVFLALAVVMFSFGGIEMISISAAEAKDPVRSVCSAAKAMMWRLAFFYVLSLFIIVALIPWADAAKLQGEIETSPFVMVFSQMHIPYIAGITNFVVLIAALSGANAALYGSTRQLHALAHDRMAPAALARTTARGVPAMALAFSTLGAVAAVVLAITGVGGIFTKMMALVTFCVVVTWFMIMFSYLSFKRREGNASPFRVWGGSATAGVAILGLIITLVSLFLVGDMATSATIGLLFFAIISVVYFVAVRKVQTADNSAFDEVRSVTEQQPLDAEQR